MSLFSITTSATHPVGRQRTNPARPTSVSSILSPRPAGRRSPRGAMPRRREFLPSAVLSTMTIRLTLGLSSAATLCKSAHCSRAAPGGVSQRSSQSPCFALTTPWQRAPGVPAKAQKPRNASPLPAALIVFLARATQKSCVGRAPLWRQQTQLGPLHANTRRGWREMREFPRARQGRGRKRRSGRADGTQSGPRAGGCVSQGLGGRDCRARRESSGKRTRKDDVFSLSPNKCEAPRAAASSALKSQRNAELVEVDCAKRKFLLHHTKGFPVE